MWVMIIWLAIGQAYVQPGIKTEQVCTQTLHKFEAFYQRTYVIADAGCFPKSILVSAVHEKTGKSPPALK